MQWVGLLDLNEAQRAMWRPAFELLHSQCALSSALAGHTAAAAAAAPVQVSGHACRGPHAT